MRRMTRDRAKCAAFRPGNCAPISAVFIAALLCATPALADERITDFSSDIRIAQDGKLTVTETIAVNAEGNAIRHGIFRVIPTEYTDRLGQRVRVGFDVLSVRRDGAREPYTVESVDDGKSIKIGDKDVFVTPGSHVYRITYETTRQIGFFKDYDELYWNVTGNFWDFPIDHAEASIKLPFGGNIRQYAAYTGAVGSTRADVAVSRPYERQIDFRITEPLPEREGLTVAVGFAKGAVRPPSKAELDREYLRDNAATVTALAGVLVLLVYFLIAWWRHGRDPRRGTVIPLFAPPKDFSPSAVRFVHRMAYDRKCYSAALVDMAVKGYLKIAENDGTYTLTRTREGEAKLSHGEAVLAAELFGGGHAITLEQSNHTRIAASISALQSSLQNEYERVYFNTNIGWFTGGVLILLAAAGTTALLCGDPVEAGLMLGLIGLGSLGTAFLLHRTYKAWMSVFFGPGSRVWNFFAALFATAFALPVTGFLILIVVFLRDPIAAPAMVALMAGGFASYLFYHLLKAPTLAGAKILDEIEGFKLYLVTAEKDRLEALNPPEVTPEVFERFLPYAIALDCENQWSRKFEAEAAAAGIDPSQARAGYVPVWYSGASFDRLGTAGFTAALGSSMASAASAASSAPGSSSGSGGGGFSGGGGGGGGGGGW